MLKWFIYYNNRAGDNDNVVKARRLLMKLRGTHFEHWIKQDSGLTHKNINVWKTKAKSKQRNLRRSNEIDRAGVSYTKSKSDVLINWDYPF